MAEMIRILLVDDHKIMRDGLRSLIQSEPDMTVVAEAGNGQQALHLARQHHPMVVVMDITMPEMNGVDATRSLVRELPDVHVVALSMEADRRFIVEVLKAGACGYVLKDSAFDELAVAIRSVAAGEVFLGQRIAEVIIREYLQRVPEEELLTNEVLSGREREVLQCIADGHSTKEIAFRFGVSAKTVENQRQSIMHKLNLYSVAELTKYAVREGLTSLHRSAEGKSLVNVM